MAKKSKITMEPTDRWIVAHFEELVEKYGGKWIIVVNKKIVAITTSPGEAEKKIRKKFPKIIPSVLHVPRKESLTCLV